MVKVFLLACKINFWSTAQLDWLRGWAARGGIEVVMDDLIRNITVVVYASQPFLRALPRVYDNVSKFRNLRSLHIMAEFCDRSTRQYVDWYALGHLRDVLPQLDLLRDVGIVERFRIKTWTRGMDVLTEWLIEKWKNRNGIKVVEHDAPEQIRGHYT
jgi:hypothetical protein